MERLPSLQVQLIGELQTLLKYPQCSSVGYIPLLQMAAVNMFAIEHTAPLGKHSLKLMIYVTLKAHFIMALFN